MTTAPMLEETIKSTVDACISRWGSDSRTLNFYDKVLLWLQPVDKNNTKEILLKLLSKFNYYTKETTNTYFLNKVNELLAYEDIRQFSVITSIKSQDGHVNSSFDLLYPLHQNPDNGDLLYDDISSIINIDDWKYLKHIILLDDICGSGKTIIDYLKRFEGKITGKHIIYIVVEISEEAFECINDYVNSMECSLTVVYNNLYKKAFTPSYIFDENVCTEASDTIRNLEISLWNNPANKNIMGMLDSQALVAFSSNTPNNTISCFWVNRSEGKWNSLFPRNQKKRPLWRDQRENKNQKMNMGYNIAKLKNNHETK